MIFSKENVRKGGEIPMGMIDTVTIKYLQQNEVFADAFNFLVHEGREGIDPESLEELDTREINVPYGGADGAQQPVQKTRDVIKSVTAMKDKKTAYLVLAISEKIDGAFHAEAYCLFREPRIFFL